MNGRLSGAGETIGNVAKKARGPALVGGMTVAGVAGAVALGSKLGGGRNPLGIGNGRSPVKSLSRGFGSAGEGIGKAGKGVTKAGKGIGKAGKGIGKAGKGIGKAGKGIGKAGKEIGKAGVTLGVGDVTMDVRRGRKQAQGRRRQSPVEVLLSGLTSRRAPE